MTLKLTDESIDLSGLTYRDYTEEETKGFRRVRSEYSQLFHPILEKLSEDASLLPSIEVPYAELSKKVEHVLALEEAEAWLRQKLEHISETRRAQNSELKPHLDQIVDLARVTGKIKPDVAGLFAELLDFLAEPSKKAVASRNKKP